MLTLDRMPVLPFLDPRLARLPGLAPLPMDEWLCDWPDTADQLRYRARLLEERRSAVLDCLPEGRAAAGELLDVLLANLATREGWTVGDEVATPAGPVAVDREDPLATIGRMVTEDFCLMGPGEPDYRLLAAVLCFPAHWTLSEKIGRPMNAIHAPTPHYDADTAMRVNRFFARLQPGNLLFRVNWSLGVTPELFTPGHHPMFANPEFLRIERQTFLRLPETGVIAFGIRTAIAPVETLTRDEARGFARAIDALTPEAQDYKGGRENLRGLRDRLLATAG